MFFSDENMDKLHRTLFEILEYVDTICKQHELNYILIGGTALGAKRHKGFIPWDDDMDIGLPRSDYEKLLEILKNQNDGYIIQDETNEDNYYLPFAKLRKKGTVFREKISKDLYKENGIFLDIFPIDFLYSKTSLKAIVSLNMIKLLYHTLRFRYCKELYCDGFTLKAIMNWLLYIPFVAISRDRLMRYLKKLMILQNDKESIFAGNLAGTTGLEKEIMRYDVIFPSRMLEFEGKQFPCPNNIDAYLKNLYGNYLELPPVEKRRTHEPLELKF